MYRPVASLLQHTTRM